MKDRSPRKGDGRRPRGAPPARRSESARTSGGEVRRPAQTQDAKDAKDAHRAIGRVYRGLRNLRGLLIVDAVVLGLMFVISLLAAPVNPVTIVLGVLFIGAALGSVMVVHEPYPWCIILAVAHTGLALLMMLVPGIMAAVAVAIAALLWWAVWQAASARSLMREYPEAWAKGNRTYTGRGGDQIGSKFRDRSRAEQKQRTRRLLLLIGLPLALLIGAALFFAVGDEDSQAGGPYVARPIEKPTTSVDVRAGGFQDDWNQSSLDLLLTRIAPSERDTIERLLRKVIRRRHWDGAFPRASTPDLTEYDAAHWYAVHTLEGYGSVRVSWVWENGDWWIVRLKFKKGGA